MNDKEETKPKPPAKGDLEEWKRQIYQRMGAKKNRCRLCGSTRGVIHKYGLNLCYKCFREVHEDLGFRKSSVHRT